MSPTVKMSKKLYSRLEQHARGFDSPEQVIERLLDKEDELGEHQEIPSKKPVAPKHKRDVTKYTFNGHEYGKGRLVLAVVRNFVQRRDETSFGDLLAAWPRSLQGSLGVFARVDEPELDIERYFFRTTEQVLLLDCTVAICNQWGKGNISNFLEAAKNHEFEIAKIGALRETKKTEKKMNKEKTLRGLVIQMWNIKGRPAWNFSETRIACLRANDNLKDRGLNPAKKFRAKIEQGDEDYLERWIMGCHFDWLNPR